MAPETHEFPFGKAFSGGAMSVLGSVSIIVSFFLGKVVLAFLVGLSTGQR